MVAFAFVATSATLLWVLAAIAVWRGVLVERQGRRGGAMAQSIGAIWATAFYCLGAVAASGAAVSSVISFWLWGS